MGDPAESWPVRRRTGPLKHCEQASGVGVAFRWKPLATRGQSSLLLKADGEGRPWQAPPSGPPPAPSWRARLPIWRACLWSPAPFSRPFPISGHSHFELLDEHLLLLFEVLLDGRVIAASPLNFQFTQALLGYLSFTFDYYCLRWVLQSYPFHRWES